VKLCAACVKACVVSVLQVYYELAAEREKQGKQGDVAIVRIEQLAPFPFDLVMREIRRYPNAEVMWCACRPPSGTQLGLGISHCFLGVPHRSCRVVGIPMLI
jgi:2-oxoglutarate dehydrogenase complex dehydrogenase (E1) component-like enzyme